MGLRAMGERLWLGTVELPQACARLFLSLLLAILLVMQPGAMDAAFSQERVEVKAVQMDGFGRVILAFPGRMDLPEYEISSENGVLALQFMDELAVTLPDISGELPDYVSISRIDPDNRGIRFGLKDISNVNRLEAGEQLFLDFLPLGWQGLPPGLPEDVVAELARRAQESAAAAELERRIEFTRLNNPAAEIKVGRHPTFTRITFEWSEDTRAEYVMAEGVATLEFFWPVELDLYPLISDLPAEITSAGSEKLVGSNRVTFKLEDGVVPRFFKNSERRFVIDIDLLQPEIKTVSAEQLLAEIEQERALREAMASQEAEEKDASSAMVRQIGISEQAEITPEVSRVGSTIRIAFPFDRETSAAVFQRGDFLWMIMDTTTMINAPDDQQLLATISDDFTVISAGDMQIVRMEMNERRLASIGSQGPSWVLSLGEDLMAPTQPLRLDRRQDGEGRFEMFASVENPVRVHQLRDPEIGDVLEIVTMMPPATGIIRNLSFVDFEVLASTHGMVFRPETETVKVDIGDREVVVRSEQGLTLSSLSNGRGGEAEVLDSNRKGFIDLAALQENNPIELNRRRQSLIETAASSEGRARENARLDLAHVLIANQLGLEAIGVLNLLIEENQAADLMDDAVLAKAAANVVAFRGRDALELLKSDEASMAMDQLIWRAMARAQMRDFAGTKSDFLASELVISSYPQWVQNRFLLAGIRAGVETGDKILARRLIEKADMQTLSQEQQSEVQLLEARLDELDQSYDEALDNYGLVIAMDVRPTRAEAILRTVMLLEKMGRLEDEKGMEILSRESIVWRGGAVEAQMLRMLARMQFDNKRYRAGFTTVREMAETFADDEAMLELSQRAQDVFVDLYINGAADSMEDLEALTLFYDFRYLTPAGARGDEIIRGLARRLIRVDLLSQAADLLEYQIDERLEGAARAQIAADLAIIYIADRKPQLALQVLNKTSIANLPKSLERQRRLLEARALIDEGRVELAIDILGQISGRDVELLRVDAYWQSGRYAKAAEQLEVIYSGRNAATTLTSQARMNLVKAAVGYVLGGDMLGLARIRSRFAGRMANFPEWPMFDYVTGAAVPTSASFREVAAQIADIDGLSAFLNSYKQTYGEGGALVPAPSKGVS